VGALFALIYTEAFLVSFDFLRAAVFLWRRPLATALSILTIAALTVSFLFSAPLSIAVFAFLIAVFRAELCALFFAVFTAIVFTRFFADLMFATEYTSIHFLSAINHIIFGFKMQAFFCFLRGNRRKCIMKTEKSILFLNKGGFLLEIINLTVENFERETLRSHLPVLVDFWAPWCGPCKTVAPVLSEMAQELTGQARICKVNIDEQPDIASALEVNNVPTFMVFKNGSITDLSVGVKSKDMLKRMLGVL